MKLLYDNKVITSTIARSSERSGYEFDDALLDPRLTRVGRTNNSTSQWIMFNLGTATQVDYLSILAHNFTSGATVVIEGHTTSDFTTPDFSQSVTISDEILEEIDEEYQFWRLTATDTTDYIEIGFVFLGDGATGPGMERSQVFKRLTTSEFSKSVTKQIYGDKRIQYKAADIQFPIISTAEKATMVDIYDAVDIVTPFVILFWENNLDVEPPLYCNFTSPPEFTEGGDCRGILDNENVNRGVQVMDKVNDYGIGDVNFSTMMDTLDKTRIGYHAVSLTNWSTTSVPAIAAGSVVEVNGALFHVTTEESITGSPSDGVVYIKIVPDGDTATAEFTNTAPEWDDEKQGWYSTTAGEENYRYLEFWMIKATSAYSEKSVLVRGPVQATSINNLLLDFNKIVLLTGTTGSSGVVAISYPSGFTVNNCMIINAMVTYGSSIWHYLGGPDPTQSQYNITLNQTATGINLVTGSYFYSKPYRLLVARLS